MFRNRVEEDPVDALTMAGLPGMAVDWFLRALGAPAAVLSKVNPEVVAHAAHPRVLSLLFPQRLARRWPDKGE